MPAPDTFVDAGGNCPLQASPRDDTPGANLLCLLDLSPLRRTRPDREEQLGVLVAARGRVPVGGAVIIYGHRRVLSLERGYRLVARFPRGETFRTGGAEPVSQIFSP
jgi:hypothetical protein